jgi:hypothetical protein
MNKEKIVRGSVIATFVTLYLMVSIISTIHVIDFFELSNPYWLAVTLAIAFEVGAAASLASLVILDKMNKGLVWTLFAVITLMQMQGNMYYAFTNLTDFSSWSELFGLIEEDVIFQKRIIAAVSGAILPLVALGFIKSLVDYIKPETQKEEESEKEEKPDDGILKDEEYLYSLQNEVKEKESFEDYIVDIPASEPNAEQYAESYSSPIKDEIEEAPATEEENNEHQDEEFSYNPEEIEETKEWDVTLMDGLEDEPTSEERDEDHELDLVLNEMVEEVEENPKEENLEEEKKS